MKLVVARIDAISGIDLYLRSVLYLLGLLGELLAFSLITIATTTSIQRRQIRPGQNPRQIAPSRLQSLSTTQMTMARHEGKVKERIHEAVHSGPVAVRRNDARHSRILGMQ